MYNVYITQTQYSESNKRKLAPKDNDKIHPLFLTNIYISF